MSVVVTPESPLTDEARALLSASQDYMASIYPPEDNFSLSTDALAEPEVTFLRAREGSTALGCVAVKSMGDYGEIKSMFVSPAARGKGVGAALMSALDDIAGEQGFAHLRLETGPELESAVRLYARHGFERRGPFGAYEDLPASLFMEKAL